MIYGGIKSESFHVLCKKPFWAFLHGHFKPHLCEAGGCRWNRCRCGGGCCGTFILLQKNRSFKLIEMLFHLTFLIRLLAPHSSRKGYERWTKARSDLSWHVFFSTPQACPTRTSRPDSDGSSIRLKRQATLTLISGGLTAHVKLQGSRANELSQHLKARSW